MLAALLHLRSPLLLATSLALVALIALLLRRSSLPQRAAIFAILAALLLSLAVGGVTLTRPTAIDDVAVMVDLSPSTRGATYRDPQVLQRRIGQLLGGRAYRLYHFAGDVAPVTAEALSKAHLPDRPADRTQFLPPPAARAVVLFSDGQFALPAVAPPTFAVIDAALDRPADARVTSLAIREETISAGFVNDGPPRTVAWTGIGSAPADRVTGSYTLNAPLMSGETGIAVRFAPGDLWPENDVMAAAAPPRARLQRWWAGNEAPTGWHSFPEPAALPSGTGDLVGAAVIVLNNVPIDAMPLQRQQQLDAYVRRLGGTLILLGGDRAFGAGGYAGSVLDGLSPLASAPPQPNVEWTVLIDASGSMAAPYAVGTRLDAALAAVRSAVGTLPADEQVSVGTFARDVRWLSTGGKPTDALAALSSQTVAPHGPTNLATAVDALIAGRRRDALRQVLLITDGGAEALDVNATAERFRAAGATLNVLAIGKGPAGASLAAVAAAGGGTVLTEADPARWSQAAVQLLRAARPSHLERTTARGSFTGALAPLGAVAASPWNRTWARSEANVVATNAATDDVPLAAYWNVGTGRVISIAFGASPATVEAAAAALARPPRDERFSVRWTDADDESEWPVTVDAVDAGRPWNGLSLTLMTNDERRPFEQIAPGRYAAASPATPQSHVATILFDGRVIDRRAVPTRYAPEFASIGNDYAALRGLATRTGGAVVTPATRGPLALPVTPRALHLHPWLATGAGVMLAAAIVAWRRG